MAKLKLLLDVDGVIVFPGFLALINEFLGTSYVIDDFTSCYIDEQAIPKEKMQEFYEFIRGKNLYENPNFLPGALEGIEALSQYYDIYICSDCINPFDKENSGMIFMTKFNLLFNSIPQEIIPIKNYIFTGTKNIFKADVQVDDLMRNLDPEIEKRILFPSYHNKNITSLDLYNAGVIKAGSDWREGWEFLVQHLKAYAEEKSEKIKQPISI